MSEIAEVEVASVDTDDMREFPMSAGRRNWWAAGWTARPNAMKQPRLAVLMFAMNTTARPTAPEESIAFGYVRNSKFHDREPGLVLAGIEALDQHFFDDYPRRAKGLPSLSLRLHFVGEAARAFYRHGRAGYENLSLRRQPPGG